MKTVLINGHNSKAAGGKSMLKNLLGGISESETPYTFVVVVPPGTDYSNYSRSWVEIISLHKIYNYKFLQPVSTAFVLPAIAKKFSVDVVLNISDVPIPTDKFQIFQFDWPYAAYPESPAWKRLSILNFSFQKFKLFLMKRYLKYVDVMIGQSDALEARLARHYPGVPLVQIPNSTPLENYSMGVRRDFALPEDKTKLLCLSYYYVHKNIEIFLELAKKFKAQSLPFVIVTTLAEYQHPNVKKFFENVREFKLEDYFMNIGPVDMENVPSLYQQCDGVILPTLLESFSGVFAESLYHEKPIFTSNYDFATAVCGEAGYYFDPLDVDSIFEVVTEAFDDQSAMSEKLRAGKSIVQAMPKWKDILQKYFEIMDSKEESQRMAA